MDIKKLVHAEKEYGIGLRREFHQYPEMGRQEWNTAKRIEEELDRMDIPHRRVSNTNVVGLIQGTGQATDEGERIIGLRADMDGLPVHEASDIFYRSRNEGVMHACGHDGHMASLLTAAKLLSENRYAFSGKVKLLFQSAEELGTGAKELIEAGEIDDLDAVFGLHIWNELEHGMVSVTAGETMASPIEFRITLKGRSGHGAMSHHALDCTVPLASLVMNLQTLVSMEFNPLSDVVLTVGRIFSGDNAYVEPGTVYNVIAGEGYMEGTIRVFNDEDGQLFQEKLTRMLKGMEALYGVKGELYYHPHAPAVINDETLAALGQAVCRRLWGEEALDHLLGKQMAGEDFSYYRKKAPSLFAFVGARNTAKLECFAHHHPKFNFDEDAIEQAACLYGQFALDFLTGGLLP